MLKLIKPGDVVLDYSSWRPTKAELEALKVKAVVRYIAPGIPRSKLITKAEQEFLFSEPYPVGVLYVYEWQADRANLGGTVGLSDGYFSREKCKELGYPAHEKLALIIAIDTNTVATNIEAHKAYSAAFDRGLGEYSAMGIYGDSDIIKFCIDFNITMLNWLVGARSWGHSLEGVHVEQKVVGSTASYDMNVVHIPFYVWLPSSNDEFQEEKEGDEPMVPYIFQLANGGIGIRHESGSRSVNGGELEGPLKGEVIYQIPPGSNWEGWVTKELLKYERDLEPQAPVGNESAKRFVFRGEGETD